MSTLKYIGTFFGGFSAGFFCALVLSLFSSVQKDQWQYKYGFTSGFHQGELNAVYQIQSEFGFYDNRLPYKFLYGTNEEVVSIETNGVKTVRVILMTNTPPEPN
jgi:hypothetical protein